MEALAALVAADNADGPLADLQYVEIDVQVRGLL